MAVFREPPAPMVWARHNIEWGRRTYIMGIVNVTPDSFSGDGLMRRAVTDVERVQRAVTLARQYAQEGAMFIDVGGESTRPGASPVSTQEELARVLPAIRAMRAVLPPDVIISIDTYKAEVAAAALEAGASLVNDIWALRRDPEMAGVVKQYGVPVVLMSNQRGSRRYEIVSDTIRFLSHSIDMALEAGIAWEHLILDPGLGFGTTPEENLTLEHRLGELRALGRPILLGASRKSTVGRVLGGLPPEERLEGTAASVALAIAQGADIMRVHDVHEMMRVVRMSDAIVRGTFTLSKNP